MIAAQFLHLFRANPNLDIKVIVSKLLKKYKITYLFLKLYRAKKKPLSFLKVDHKSSYSKLDKCMAVKTQTNMGSTVDLQTK